MKSTLDIKKIYKIMQDTYRDYVSVSDEVINNVILLMPKNNPV